MHARWLNGNLIYWDAHQARWIDAWGPGVVKFLEHFVQYPQITDGMTGWTTTLVEAGAGETTVAPAHVQGGALLITTDAAENDGANLQRLDESWKLTTGKPLYFGARFKISEATQSDFFIGLAITDTDILGGVTDSVGFQKVDASTQINAVLNKNSTATTAALHTAVADTYVILEFLFDGTAVHFYHDGVAIADPAQTNLPDDEELAISIHVLTGEAVVHSATIDWIRVIQLVN